MRSDIKKHIASLGSLPVMGALLFVCVGLTCYLCIPYTMKSWEANGLFLTTPDYLQEVRERPHPTLQMATDYVCQFFYYRAAGAMILALLPTALFLLLGAVLRHRIVRILMAAGIVGGVVVCVLRPAVREGEKIAHLELAAEARQWNDVLKIVTPEAAREDPRLMPYALLALAINGELAYKMQTYPVRGIEDFDTQGQPCHEYYFFKMVLYDCMGCPNEAMHCNFQAVAGSPYGTSFGTLRRQVRFCQDAGNQVLADKYREILSHSTLHRNYRPRGESMPPDTLRHNRSGQIPTITKSLRYNLALFINMGIRSPQMCNYFLCALLAANDLEGFAKVMKYMEPTLPQPLPPIYTEALHRYAETHPGSDLPARN